MHLKPLLLHPCPVARIVRIPLLPVFPHLVGTDRSATKPARLLLRVHLTYVKIIFRVLYRAGMPTSDDYETPKKAYEMIADYIPPHQRLYDPFYCTGRCVQYMREVFQPEEVLHSSADAFERIDANTFDVILTNPPFSCKYRVIDFLKQYKKPTFILLPFEMLCTLRYAEMHEDSYRILLPARRIQYEQGGKVVKTNFHSFWLCLHVDLPHQITYVV